jgi:hypothetical protein
VGAPLGPSAAKRLLKSGLPGPRPPADRDSPQARGPQLSNTGYRIDYDDLDVVDLVTQIRERSRRGSGAAADLPEVVEERARARVRAAVDLDDRRPYELQRALHLEGTWNVTPHDLVESRRRGAGGLLSTLRRLARPVLKLFANFELPLFKQFKINLGVADTLHELLVRTAELEARLDDVSRRLEELEGRRSGNDD